MQITNVTARRITAGVQVDPGETKEVPADLIEGVRKCPPFRAGWLVEGKVKMPPPAKPQATDPAPSTLPQDETAAKIKIGACTDLATIMAWADTERRPAVLAALEARAKSPDVR